MKTVMMGLAGLFLLAGCGGGDTQLKADCFVIAADPEGKDAIEDMQTDAETFCSCMVALVATRPADEADLIKATLNRISLQSAETGEDVETVASLLIQEAMAEPDNPQMQAQRDGITAVGNLIDEIEAGFSDHGTCMVPAS